MSALHIELSGDLTWITDEKSGFSAGLPGKTSELQEATGSLRESVVTLNVPTVEVGFRIDVVEHATQPDALAASLAQAFASSRSAGQVKVRSSAKAQAQTWGADAAASALYLRPGGSLRVTPMEEVLVLVRKTDVAYVTRRFEGQTVNSVTWGILSSVMNAHLGWGVPRTDQAWPASEWLQATVEPTFTPFAMKRSQELASLLAAKPSRASEIVTRLYGVARGIESPHRVLDKQARRTHLLYLDLFESEAQSDALEADISRVKTARDLRGMALVWLRAAQAVGFGLPG